MQSRREFLGAGAAALAGAALGQDAEAARPNVLWILTDQHRADVAGYAGDGRAHTPSLDRLAEQSVQVTDMYCQIPLCLPARHSLLTGCYPHTHGAATNTFPFIRDERTIAHVMKDAGYATALIGKTHCDTSGFELVRSQQDQYDDFLAAHPDGERPGYEHVTYRAAEDRFEYVRAMNPGGHGAGEGEIFYMEEAVLRETAAFLRERPADRPFFVWASFLSPHPPLFPPPEFHALFADADLPLRGDMRTDAPGLFPAHVARRKRQELDRVTPEMLLNITRSYYASLAWADHCVGALLDVVDELDLSRDTLVVYTSDHGELLGEHSLLQKRAFYEGAVRVPCLFRWPGRLPEGGVRRNVAEHLDLTATVLALCGVPVPASYAGRSMVPLLANPDAEWHDRALVEDQTFQERFGLSWAIREGPLKYVHHTEEEDGLFDLSEDPGEARNLAAGGERAGDVERLRDLFVTIGDATDWIIPRAR